MMRQMMTLGSIAKYKIRDLFTDERGDVNVVAIVVLIGIAVALAVIFKGKIETLLTNLFDTITRNANEAVGGDTN